MSMMIYKDKRIKAIVSQTNNGTFSKATLGKVLRDRAERLWAFPKALIPSLTLSAPAVLECSSCWPQLFFYYGTKHTATVIKRP